MSLFKASSSKLVDIFQRLSLHKLVKVLEILNQNQNLKYGRHFILDIATDSLVPESFGTHGITIILSYFRLQLCLKLSSLMYIIIGLSLH